MSAKETISSEPNMLESEEFWVETFDVMFSEERLGSGDSEIEALLKLLAVKPCTVLDLACGPGRHSVALAKRGFKVTAVDFSSFLIAKAGEHAAEHKQTIEFLQADMRTFVRAGAFSLCLCLFSSFVMDNSDDELAALRNVYESLSPGGIFVLDIMGKELLAKIFQPESQLQGPGGALLKAERKILDGWSRIQNTWTITRNGNSKVYTFRHNLHSACELEHLLRQAGFAQINIYGGFNKQPYDNEAARLVAVARKTATGESG